MSTAAVLRSLAAGARCLTSDLAKAEDRLAALEYALELEARASSREPVASSSSRRASK
jgi:hypothetical protein